MGSLFIWKTRQIIAIPYQIKSLTMFHNIEYLYVDDLPNVTGHARRVRRRVNPIVVPSFPYCC